MCIPIVSQQDLAKLHLRNKWVVVSGLCKMHRSHVCESRSIPFLFSKSLVLSLFLSSNHKNTLCFIWHLLCHMHLKAGWVCLCPTMCLYLHVVGHPWSQQEHLAVVDELGLTRAGRNGQWGSLKTQSLEMWPKGFLQRREAQGMLDPKVEHSKSLSKGGSICHHPPLP